MDTTLSRPPAGQLLDGRYRVDAWLAHGGMATVYLGTDTRLDRRVALKIAHQEFCADEEFVRRFIGEARSVARLSSPNVVAVFDQGSDGNVLYLAMEYVAGRTLRELLRERGSLSPRESLDISEGVLTGLAAAHQAGIVHRDVKPENVLLTGSGAIKVADFGLARAAAAASQTKTGMIIGTAAYLAPEQVSHSTSDARTDVYAAGVMLFEMLTGAQPHTGETPLAVAYKHVHEVVPAPSSLVPGLPPSLDALVALATSRNPDLRPADAGQFLHAITEVRRGLPIAGLRPRGQHAAPSGQYQESPGMPANGSRALPDPQASGAAAAGETAPSAPLAGIPPADSLASGVRPGGSSTPDALAAGASTPGRSAAGTSTPGTSTPGTPAADSPAAGLPPAGLPAAGLPPAGLRPSGAHGPGRPGSGSTPGVLEPAALLPWLGGTHGGTPELPPPPASARQDGFGGTNHTLIVPASGIAGQDHEGPGRLALRRPAGYRSRGEPMLQRLLFSRRLVYLIGACALAGIIFLVTWWVTAGQYATVPQIQGMSAGIARTELHNLGFTVRNDPGQHSNLPTGEVIKTVPAIGSRAVQGSTVAMVVSIGPVKIAVPQVTGLTVPAAQAALRTAGLIPGSVLSAPSTIQRGIVISTTPVAGTSWPQPRPVTITQSAGPPMPNLVGQPLPVAQQTAQSDGFQLNQVADTQSTQPAGQITGQSPAAGTPITPGEVVTVRVSNGPPMTNIPNVQGLTVEQATHQLTAAGFNVAVDQQGPGHRVINYSPTGQAPAGSTITIVVGFTFSLP